MHRSNNSERHTKPLVIGHRGASGLAPENTIAAFRLALAQGAQGIEFDVQLSSDGQPVVIHDIRLNRTTNARGFVGNLTVAELSRLDAGSWFERRIALRPRTRNLVERARIEAGSERVGGESVPTLEATLALLSSVQVARIYIELKSKPSSRNRLAASVLSLVRKFNLESSVTILSFDHEAVRLAKKIDSQIRTAATIGMSGRALVTPRSIIESAKSATADEVALHFGLATRRTVASLKDRGLGVSVWTVNRQIIMRRLIAHGVDAIMTNYPDRLIEVLKSPDKLLIRAKRNLRSLKDR